MYTAGMEELIAPIMVIHGLSLLFMCIMIAQFLRIHKKRIGLLIAFDTQGEMGRRITSEKIQSYLAVIVYFVVTLLITAATSFLFFVRPHWL